APQMPVSGVLRFALHKANDRHEAEFPEELVRRVIKLYSPSGGIILDPFVGSGTTTSVAKRLGIDVMPEYVDLARRRTHDA
ncbi:MAG: site-specific DNA-methyltransferase, partial [Bacteroidota bacterium]|nr:site-specific DNA-methyltransferase [Bacteroidota bacterium]